MLRARNRESAEGRFTNFGKYMACSNGLVLPWSLDTATTNYVRNYYKVHRVPKNANWRMPKFKFSNYVCTHNLGDLTGTATVTLQATLLYNNTFYQLTFGGSSSYSLTNGTDIWCDAVKDVLMLANTEYGIIITVNGPSSGSYQYPSGSVTNGTFGEFAIAGTSTAINFAQNGFGVGATATATVSGGNITACTRTNAGTGYTASAYVYAYEIGPDGVFYNKNIGSVTVSGGGITNTFTVSSGTPPSGLSAWVNPTLRISYGHASLGLSSAVRTWCISGAIGIPDRGVNAAMFNGDSIMRGNGNALTADLYQNQGIYEAGVNNECGIVNVAVGSMRGYNLDDLEAARPLYWAHVAEMSKYVSHTLLGIGTNDIVDGRSAAQIKTTIEILTAKHRTYGTPTSVAPMLPRVSGTYTSAAGQTPLANFDTAGIRGTVNAQIRNGTIVSDWGVVDGDLLARDSGSIDKFRSDGGVAYTQDGVHESQVLKALAANDSTFKGCFRPLYA